MTSVQTSEVDGRFRGKHVCVICRTTVHSSNVKIKCCSCLDWAHFKCRGTEDTSFICKNCISSNLPFSEVENGNDFNYEVGLYHCSLSSQLSDLNNISFSLNPFNDSENNKFINNSDIDADDNYFQFFYWPVFRLHRF